MKPYSRDNFKCSCGCEVNNINPKVVGICNDIFEETDRYFNINSGFRCLYHNRSIGSKDTSSHVKGLACDLATTDSHSRFLLVKALIDLDIQRIGYYKTFIHFDIDKDKTQDIIW